MKRDLLLLGVLYAALALGFNLAIPYDHSPDEAPHVFYLQELSRGNLPSIDPDDPGDRRERSELHQPPLYYLLCLPVWKAATAAGLEEAAAGKWVRLVSMLLFGLGLGAIYWLACLVVARPGSWVPLVATGFAALLPQRLAIAAGVNNDALTEPLATLSLCAMVLIVRSGAAPKRALALGGLLGLGLLTKMSLLVLWPVAALALLLGSRKREEAPPDPPPKGRGKRRRAPAPARFALDAGQLARGLALAFGAGLAVGGWWLARNQLLYGELLGTGTFVAYLGDLNLHRAHFAAAEVDLITYYVWFVLAPTFATFWGAFGHLDRPHLFMGMLDPDRPRATLMELLPSGTWVFWSWLYPLLLVATAAALVGAVLWYRRHGRDLSPERRGILLLLGLQFGLVFVTFLQYNWVFYQAQGRYFFPALGPISLLLAAGWLALAPERRRPAAARAILAGMLALALYALFGVVMPAFAAGGGLGLG